MGLLWALLRNGRQRRQVERLRQGRNIAHNPIVRRRGRQPRSCLVRPWLHSERRLQFGHFYRLMEELRLEDGDSFRNFLNMEPAMFDVLLHRIRPRIAKQYTWYRQAIEPGIKLALTLRHLATGDTSYTYIWLVVQISFLYPLHLFRVTYWWHTDSPTVLARIKAVHCVQNMLREWLRRTYAGDTPHVRMKRRAIAAGTSRHRIKRHTFVIQTP